MEPSRRENIDTIQNLIQELREQLQQLEDSIQEPTTEYQGPEVYDRIGRRIYLGNRVRAHTTVNFRRPIGKVVNFIDAKYRGEPVIYVQYQDNQGELHKRFGKNLYRI